MACSVAGSSEGPCHSGTQAARDSVPRGLGAQPKGSRMTSPDPRGRNQILPKVGESQRICSLIECTWAHLPIQGLFLVAVWMLGANR